MGKPDSYNDGYAVVVLLARPATAEDIQKCDAALEGWLNEYENAEGQAYGSSGRAGEVSSTRVVLWADRIVDPEGNDRAYERVSRAARELEALLPGSQVRIDAAAVGSNEDMRARLGVSPLRASADSLVDRAREGQLKPQIAWILGLFALRYLLYRVLEMRVTANLAVILGVGALAWASRERSPKRVTLGALAVLAVSAFAITQSAGASPRQFSVLLLLEAGALLAWGVAWSRPPADGRS